MASKPLRIQEYDEAGKVIATYAQSEEERKGFSRVDYIAPKDLKTLWQTVVDVFLPVGFPHSVTDDYLEYQIYDSLQAFSSSIASLLSSRAVLSSVGVGDSTASPTTAILLSILQDSAGRLSTILFAHNFGMSLEPECKMYRLLADILNDIGFVLDCFSPILPKWMRVVVLSFSSILRSLCGVAAGSSKASLSAHFARQGNLGELNAKDSSQETVISLVGMLVGSWVITWIEGTVATWTALVLLLSIHLETNRRAVRAVKMRTLNRQRATLVFHEIGRGRVPSHVEIANQERIFEWDGVLRDSNHRVLGYCAVGAPLSRLMSSLADKETSTQAVKMQDSKLQQVLDVYKNYNHILWSDKSSRPGKASLFIVLKQDAGPKDVIVAWWQALIVANELAVPKEKEFDFEQLIQKSLRQAWELFNTHKQGLLEKEWNLGVASLETSAGTRVAIES